MNENVKKVVARILKDIQVEMSDELTRTLNGRLFSVRNGSDGKAPSGMKVEPY